MKITIVQGAFLPVPALRGGAVEKVWLSLGREFARRGHEVTHVSRSFPGLPETELRDGVRHRRVAGFDAPRGMGCRLWRDLVYSARVRGRLPEADIVVTNTFWLPVLLRSAARGKIYVHAARFPKRQMFLYRHADRVQAVSGAVAEAILRQEPALAGKVRVIPNPVPVGDAAAVMGHPRDRRVIYTGRLHPEKGCHLLIRAFVEAARKLDAGWKLRLTGPWKTEEGGGGAAYRQDLLEQAAVAPGCIEITEPLFEKDALEALYRSARLMVYPSLAEQGESFGLAPLEAMGQGCPALVSGLACFRDFIADGENGFVFDHRAADPVAGLAARLVAVLGNEEGLQAAAARGYETSADYRVETVAERYLADFATLLAGMIPFSDRQISGAMLDHEP